MSSRSDAWRRRFARPGDPTRVIGRRCLAFAVDASVVLLMLFLAVAVTPGSVDIEGECPVPVPDGKACFQYENDAYLVDGRHVILFVIVLAALLTVVLVVFRRLMGTTLGKWLFRIRVVDELGRPARRRRLLLRTLVLPVDVFFLVLPIGLWLAILTPGHRRIGDFLARTWVVRSDAVGRSPVMPPLVT